MPSVRGPAQLIVRARSGRPSLRWNLVSLTLSERRLRREAALEAELRPEAHIDQRAHLRGGEIHERSITPTRLQHLWLGAAPERLYLLLELKPLCCTGRDRWRTGPSPVRGQAVRTYFGRPNSSMRL